MMKKILSLLAVLVFIAGGSVIYNEIMGLKTDLKAIDEQAKKVISVKTAENSALIIENNALKAKDAANEAEKARLQAELATKTAENDKLRAELRTAPPETVLAKTQQWLNTTEVWLRANAANQVEAVFSLAAFRLNADSLAEHQYFKFDLVPSLRKQLKFSEDQNVMKTSIISNQEIQLGNHIIIEAEKDKQISGRDDTIKILKKANFWRDLRNVGYGVVADRVLDFVYHLLNK